MSAMEFVNNTRSTLDLNLPSSRDHLFCYSNSALPQPSELIFSRRRQQTWPFIADEHRSLSTEMIPTSPQEGHSHFTAGHPPHLDFYVDQPSVYLTPPSTGSEPKKSIPLPGIAGSSLFITSYATGGVLDSPLVMHHKSLASHVPISPPPTLPITTLALPDSDSVFPTAHGEDGLESLPSQCTQEVTDGQNHLFSHDEEPQLETDERYPRAIPRQLLSPLSPEWTSTSISDAPVSEASALLSEPSCRKQKCKRDMNRKLWLSDSRSSPRTCFGFHSCPQSPTSVDDGDSIACSNREDGILHFHDNMESDMPFENDPWWEHPSDTLSTPPISPKRSGASALSGPHLFLDEIGTPQPTRPFLPLLDIPKSYRPPVQIPHDFNGSIDNGERHSDFLKNGMDIDDQMILDTPFSPHFPPSTDILDEPPLTPIPNVTPSIPSITPPPSPPFDISPLPELDSLELSFIPPTYSPSPSRRSFAPLPEMDIGEEPVFLTPNSTPTKQLLSLPGSDIDDDLIPIDLYSPNGPAFSVPSHGTSLLLIDDPNDIPPPRSPSPENFDLDIPMDEFTDPDVRKLYELRKKAIAAERAARQLEAQMLAQGAVHMRAEARKARKREKERSREIGALLRLKLSEKGRDAERVNVTKEAENVIVTPKRMITNLSQLVARMMFRRHETVRPLVNRKSASSPNDYVKSSLSRSVDDFDGVDLWLK